jgi:hypothetical protein
LLRLADSRVANRGNRESVRLPAAPGCAGTHHLVIPTGAAEPRSGGICSSDLCAPVITSERSKEADPAECAEGTRGPAAGTYSARRASTGFTDAARRAGR